MGSAVGCSTPAPPADSGDARTDTATSDSPSATDSTTDDAAGDVVASDVAANDVAVNDSSATDGASSDGGESDATSSDSATTDSGASADGAADSAPSDVATDTRDASAPMDSGVFDGGVTDSGASDGGMVCSVEGDWVAMSSLVGTVYVRFRGGVAEFAPNASDLGTSRASPLGSYTIVGGSIIVTNSPMAAFTCPVTDRGEYRLTFDATCGSLTLNVTSEMCGVRSTILNSLVLRRFVADGGVADSGVVSDGGVVSDSGACTLRPRDFSVPVPGGMTLYFRFAATGRWLAALSEANLRAGTTIDIGAYSESGGRIVMTDDSSGISGCAVTDRGEYTTTFSADCRTARWTVVSDTCTGRRAALDGSTLTQL
ncbi:MAG: hypothetical protein JNK05_39210 [Myxococcales bacterium]|nr:hypothetical protein [Myxococcales bacterium]